MDPHNNTFKPIIKSHDPQGYELLIFNRWGEIIFESHNSLIGWDGTHNNKIAKDGTYVWKITLMENGSDKKYEYTGHVNLIR